MTARPAPSQPAQVQTAGWSIAQTALRVGVSAPTLRSWEQRYGIRPSARTAGGHRRYTAGDIAELQHLARLISGGMAAAAAATDVLRREQTPATASERRAQRPTAPLGTLAERFDHAADMLDAAKLARIAAALINTRGVIDAWTSVFAPYLIELGRRWDDTGTGVECEHVAVAALQSVLDRYAWTRSQGRGGQPALLTATAAEAHTLPLYAVAGALAERDISARVLGTLPADSVLAAVTKLTPGAVLVWARSDHTSDNQLLKKLVTDVPNVCAAGPGWRTRNLPTAVTHTTDLSSTVDLLAAWVH